MRNLAKLKLASSSVWRVAQRFKHQNFDADKVEQNRFERTRAKVLEIENVVQIIRECYVFLENKLYKSEEFISPQHARILYYIISSCAV